MISFLILPAVVVLLPTFAEQWGRPWITIDTSRVAVALARQRLLTSSFEYYKLKDESKGVAGGFVNKTVPHIILKSIAQNTALDPIFAKYEIDSRRKAGDAEPRVSESYARNPNKIACQACGETGARGESHHR